MTFAQKREALARDLGLAADTPLPTVIEAGLRAMGMVPAPGSIALQMVNTDQVPMPFVCDMEYTLDMGQSKWLSTSWVQRCRSGCAQPSSRCGLIHPPEPPCDAPEEVKTRCIPYDPHTPPTRAQAHANATHPHATHPHARSRAHYR